MSYSNLVIVGFLLTLLSLFSLKLLCSIDGGSVKSVQKTIPSKMIFFLPNGIKVALETTNNDLVALAIIAWLIISLLTGMFVI